MHDVPHADRDAALLEVGEGQVAAVADVHHQMVGVVAVGTGRIVGVVVGHLDDPPVGRRQHWDAEADVVGKRGATSSRVRPPVRAHPLEVDSVALVLGVTVEQDAAPSVLHEPLAGQWRVEHHRIGARDGYRDQLDSEEARQQGHDHVGGHVDAPERDDRQRRQQDQAGGEGRDHDAELGDVQGEPDPCEAGGHDSAEQPTAQPDVQALHQMDSHLPRAGQTGHQTAVDAVLPAPTAGRNGRPSAPSGDMQVARVAAAMEFMGAVAPVQQANASPAPEIVADREPSSGKPPATPGRLTGPLLGPRG